MKRVILILTILSPILSQGLSEWSGHLKFDYRGFTNKGLYPGQEQHFLSTAFELKYYMDWADGDQTLNFTGFARYDQQDDKRSHADIRELYWQYIADNWEISLGLKKIFWGVIETNHLIDIINQTDVVESFDGEQKLGQPMLHFSYPSDYGTFDAFVLPFFRQQHFPGENGRLRTPLQINTDLTRYESAEGKNRVDLAARFSQSYDLVDIGISHFYGTNRNPTFLFENNQVIPFYTLINQTGLDVQVTGEDMLYKLELIHQRNKQINFTAFSFGLEYTFANVSNSGIDIGILSEYHFDDRIKSLASGFDNDLFFGSRMAFNDAQSLEILYGSLVDLENGSHLFSIEASRRFWDNFKINLELRTFTNIKSTDFLYALRDDTFLQFTIARYF